MSGILSMSNRLTIKKIFSLPVVPDVSISVVGVQDVAEAHVMAMENENANGKRFLLSEKTIKLKDLSNILKSAGFKKVPTLVIPNFLLRFLALFTPSLKMIAKRLGKEEKLHTANANNVLGWYPNRVELEIINSAKQLYETGLLKN
jgi:nucleoside-diphosphate-sugar epimerase